MALREVRLTINRDEWWVTTPSEARLLLQSRRPAPHAEIWLTSPDDQALCLLVHGDSAWLLYLREEGDSGFTSDNPEYDGPDDAMIGYVLANGQTDEYPASSAVPLPDALQAAEYFVETFEPAPFVEWIEADSPFEIFESE